MTIKDYIWPNRFESRLSWPPHPVDNARRAFKVYKVEVPQRIKVGNLITLCAPCIAEVAMQLNL